MSIEPDYFMLAHTNSQLSYNPKLLLAYKACFKHALLFHRKALIADYMVVNSPNFRIAYHGDTTFRELICDEFVEIAHFDKYKDGQHFTLSELREFYRQGEDRDKGRTLFHRNLPKHFRTGEFDPELAFLQNNIVQRFPHSENRDPLFTKYVEDGEARAFLKRELGSFYSSYQVAYDLMREDVMKSTYPVFGIIHFDPEHSYKGDQNIFDYMAKVPRIRDARITVEELKKRLGAKIACPHRALMMRSEMKLLKTHAILPADLSDYRPFVLPEADSDLINAKEREERRIPIDVAALSIQSIAALSVSEIREYRKLGEPFFTVMDRVTESGNVSVSEISSALNSYATKLNFEIAKKQVLSPTSGVPVNGFLRVVRGELAKRDAVEVTIAVVVQIVTFISSTTWAYAPTVLLNVLPKIAEGRLKEWAKRSDEENAPDNSINADIIKYDDGSDHLTQYK